MYNFFYNYIYLKKRKALTHKEKGEWLREQVK